jgi:hypothetical protein
MHAPPKIGAAMAAYPMPTKSTKQNSAESQYSQRLPKSNLAPAKKRRQQPVPKVQHHFATDEGEKHNPNHCRRCYEIPFSSHLNFLSIFLYSVFARPDSSQIHGLPISS